VSKNQNILKGIKPALWGLILMALVYAGAAAARTFGGSNKVEVAAIAGLGLAWLIVMAGTFFLRKVRPEFEYAFFASIVSVIALLTQGGLGIKNHLNNMNEQSFIQIDVMFFGYIALLAMIIVYRLLMQGLAGEISENKDGKNAYDWKSTWVISLVLIFAGTLILPIASLFGSTTKLALSAVVILIILIVEVNLCLNILNGAKKLQKKR